MLKCFLFFLTTSLCALPVGNPWEMYLYGQDDFTNCDFCFPKFCWNQFSIRAGYYGDYVFNRYLEVDENLNTADIDQTKATTNALLVGVGLCNRLDLFATLGASKFSIKTPASAFGLKFAGVITTQFNVITRNNIPSFDPNGLMEINTESNLSWSAGLRGVLWKCGNCVLGAEGQYFQTRPKIARIDLPPISQNLGGFVLINAEDIVFTTQAPSTIYLDHTAFFYKEVQLGLSIAQAMPICSTICVVPYAAANFAYVWVDMDHAIVQTTPPGAPAGLGITLTQGPNPFSATLNDLRQQQTIGYTIGLGLIGCSRFSANIEWRFVMESAFSTNFQFRF